MASRHTKAPWEACSIYVSRVSRWDIAFATLELCRATSKTSKAHLVKAKHVLRYLKGRGLNWTSPTGAAGSRYLPGQMQALR